MAGLVPELYTFQCECSPPLPVLHQASTSLCEPPGGPLRHAGVYMMHEQKL